MLTRNQTADRDRVLTEKVIRACWHEWPGNPTSVSLFGRAPCKKCGTCGYVHFIDFSTWAGFGELWEQLKQRKHCGDFLKWLTQKCSWEEWELKNPSQRGDAVFEFWKEKGEKLDKGQG